MIIHSGSLPMLFFVSCYWLLYVCLLLNRNTLAWCMRLDR